MPAPPVESWRRASDEAALHRLLGIRADDIGAGFAQYRVESAPGATGGIDGSEREDPGRVSTFAVTTAADLAVVSAASTGVERGREEMNGTAELNLTYVAQPSSSAVVRAEVVHRGARVAVADVRVTDAHGSPIAFGRGTYSLRPVRQSGAAS